MSCREFEKQIVLFSELTFEEQAVVNGHVQKCESCTKFLASQTNMASTIRKAAGVVPEPKDQVDLTNRIMAKIKTKEQGRWKLVDLRSIFTPSDFVRYGMAAVSVGLLVFLGAELFAPGSQEKVVQDTANSIVLNRKDFREKLLNAKTISGFSLASQCKSPFNITKINADCLKQRTSLN